MVKRELKTVEEVISELGGFRAVAELTGRPSISAAPNWKLRHSFPTNTYAVMKSALAEKGLTAPGALWGMPEPERVAS
jgi:hypothetical protein